MTRIEQPLPVRRDPTRGVNVQIVNQEEDDEPDLEDVPPPDPNHNYRPRRQYHCDRDREEGEGQGNKDIKLVAPTFVGKVKQYAYLDWERHME